MKLTKTQLREMIKGEMKNLSLIENRTKVLMNYKNIKIVKVDDGSYQLHHKNKIIGSFDELESMFNL